MKSLEDALFSPSQVATRVYSQALDSVTKAPKSTLTRKSYDGSHYVLSPSITKTVINPETSTPASHEFTVAALVDGPTANATNGSQLSLVASGNVSLPIAYINSTSIGYPLTSPEDNSPFSNESVDHVLDEIYDRVSLLVAEDKREKERAAEQEQTRKRSRRNERVRKLQGTGAGVAIMAVLAVAGFGIKEFYDSENAKEAAERAAAEQVIIDYDNRNIVLSGTPTKPGDASLLTNDPDAMAVDAPDFTDTIELHPREILITADEHKMIARIETSSVIRAVADGPEQNVVVQVLKDGTVWLSALPNEFTEGTTAKPVYKVLIQRQPLK